MDSNNCDGHAEWRTARAVDLYDIQKIADEIHLDLRERSEVFKEKFNLFTHGCFVLIQCGEVVGYGFSYPWLLKCIPRLNRFLGSLPRSPECLFIHDVVVLQQARGHGAAGVLIGLVARLAVDRGIPKLALVSVYNTHSLWARFGFEIMPSAGMPDELKSYGDTAQYMICKLDGIRN
jgi:GNAT superfamily N-acetyltransferase